MSQDRIERTGREWKVNNIDTAGITIEKQTPNFYPILESENRARDKDPIVTVDG